MTASKLQFTHANGPINKPHKVTKFDGAPDAETAAKKTAARQTGGEEEVAGSYLSTFSKRDVTGERRHGDQVERRRDHLCGDRVARREDFAIAHRHHAVRLNRADDVDAETGGRPAAHEHADDHLA